VESRRDEKGKKRRRGHFKKAKGREAIWVSLSAMPLRGAMPGNLAHSHEVLERNKVRATSTSRALAGPNGRTP